ncbi:hypothetical protein GGR56DRAFT_662644 [Xylariaceae sp. FL0804]|nr:hypothetical protein GGR56DRAFT_662644 [Xylariaceae sp. FL0804]
MRLLRSPDHYCSRYRYRAPDPATRSAALALLAAVAVRHLSPWEPEAAVCAEALAWLVLPLAFGAGAGCSRILSSSRPRPPIGPTRPPTPTPAPMPSLLGGGGGFDAFHPAAVASAISVWVVAFCIGVACVYEAEESSPVESLPLLTPLLLAAQRYCLRPLDDENDDSRTTTGSMSFSSLASTPWGTTLVASAAVVSLSDWSLGGGAMSAIPVASLLVVFVALSPRFRAASRLLPSVDIANEIVPLSRRVVAVLVGALGVESLIFGRPSIDVEAILALGLARASFWYYTIETAQHSSWLTATAVVTFSLLSTLDPAAESSETRAFAHVVLSCLALGQVIQLLPKRARAKSMLWAFALLSLVPYVLNLLAMRAQYSSLVTSLTHPVEELAQRARADFKQLLQRQSTSYAGARDVYRQRYGVEPPPGFEGWYGFARAHESPIIDEFDMIHDAVSPFWALSGRQVREVMERIYHQEPDSELWYCSFSGSEAKTRCDHHHRTFDRNIHSMFDTLLGDLPGVLPDMTFLVNHLDEPRVLIPPQPPGHGPVPFNITDLSHRPAWDALTKFCGPPTTMPSRDPQYPLPFVTDVRAATDLCQQSSSQSTEHGSADARRQHGLALSPATLRLVEGRVPVLSTGAPAPMGDVPLPSPAYWLDRAFRYDAAADPPWPAKRHQLYWAGSTTGGFATAPDAATDADILMLTGRAWHTYLREEEQPQQQGQGQEGGGGGGGSGDTSGGRVLAAAPSSSFLNGRLFDVAFGRILQCSPTAVCRAERRRFAFVSGPASSSPSVLSQLLRRRGRRGLRPWASSAAPLAATLAFDTDGNGISGRFRRLLASRSAPLKQTILREWHDERLVPWLHYVPVSLGLAELPELVLHLTRAPRGRRVAREVAEAGRAWTARALRDVDAAVYVYRLLLELARLQDPARPAGGV